MVYVRGNKRDYDEWEAMGNEGWGYDNVFKYFLKSEDNRNPYLAKTPYHKTGGYLTIQETPWRTPLSIAFLQAGREMGYQIRDINGEKQTGFMLTQGNYRKETNVFGLIGVFFFSYYPKRIALFNGESVFTAGRTSTQLAYSVVCASD